MCSLPPTSSAGIQNRLLGGVEGERSLPNRDFSSQNANSDIDLKIMQLEMKKTRLEAQINLSKAQTMFAEMELHLVEIELRQELWRRRSEAQVRPPAKSQTRGPYRRLLVRKQIPPTGRTRYRKPKTYTQDKRHETSDATVNVEENVHLSHPVDDQSHHEQVGELDHTEQVEVVADDQRSPEEGASEINPNGGEEQHNSRFGPDQCHLDAAQRESPNTVVPEILDNRIDHRDAALIANSRDDTNAKHAGEKTTEINKANIIGKEDDKHQYLSCKEQKSNDSKAKTIKKVKRPTYEGTTATSNTRVNKDEENNNNGMHQTNTEALSTRSQKGEKKSSTHEKLTAVTAIENNSDIKSCSITMVRIPIRLRTLNYCISPEINNNDVNTQNSETGVDAVDTTISQIKEIESTLREKRTLSGTKGANSTNAIEGTGAVENIAPKLRSTCVKVIHKDQNKNEQYSNEKKKSKAKNIEGKENVSNVSKERHRSRDSNTKSSNKDKKYESKRYTTSTSNVNRDKEAEKNKNDDRHKSNTDKSLDKSRRNKDTGNHRHKKDENGTNKDNAKNKENQSKPFTLIKITYDQTKVDECKNIKNKSSSVKRTTVMQSSSGSEGAENIDAVREKETENNDNYFLGREADAFDSKWNILDKATQELQDMGNNLLFEELRNCSVKKERSLSLSSLETLKLYAN